MCLKLDFYVNYIQWRAYHILKISPHDNHSPNSHELSLVNVFTITTIHELITSQVHKIQNLVTMLDDKIKT
jgi:hypothetical protein